MQEFFVHVPPTPSGSYWGVHAGTIRQISFIIFYCSSGIQCSASLFYSELIGNKLNGVNKWILIPTHLVCIWILIFKSNFNKLFAFDTIHAKFGSVSLQSP